MCQVNVPVIPYKDTGTCVLRVEDEMLQQLDDHILLTQAMHFSPYRKFFEKRIINWENTLHVVRSSALVVMFP
jgi:dynein heavy chain